MLNGLSLADIGSRLLNPDLKQFLLVNKYCYALSHEIWVLKLEVEYNIPPADYSEPPLSCYRRLPIIPQTYDSSNEAAGRGDLLAVKYLALLHPPSLPDFWGANVAAGNGDLKMVQYLISLGILPTSLGANNAVSNWKPVMLNYLSSRVPPILPTPFCLDWLVETEELKKVQFLVSLGISPTQQGADWAVEAGQLKMVQYLVEELGILPTQEGIDKAVKNGHTGVVQYLAHVLN